jgi:hypothetical protein
MVTETRLFSRSDSESREHQDGERDCRKMFAGHDEMSFAGGVSLIAQPATGGQQMGA